MKSLAKLLAVLAWLLAGLPAYALSPAQQRVIFQNPCQQVKVSIDFVHGQNCAGGQSISNVQSIPGWSFTRASTKTALNSAGAVVPFATGVPAITDLGFLPEAASTNLALWSQDISNAAWTKTDITVGASIAAPDGTITAALATAGSAGTDTLAGNSAAITASSTNTISIHLKKSGSQWLRLVFADVTGTDGFNQWVDVTNGVLGTSTLRGSGTRTDATIQALINGWYRVTLTGVASTRTSLGLSVVSASGDGSITRVNGATYYPWGYQVEQASAASSYILTTSASATRAADVAKITGLSAPSHGTLLVYGLIQVASGQVGLAALNDGTANNRADLRYSNGGILSFGSAGGVSQWSALAPSGSAALGTPFHAALSFTVGAQIVTLNGAGNATATGASIGAGMTQLQIGAVDNGIAQTNGYIQRVILYPNPNTGLTQ